MTKHYRNGADYVGAAPDNEPALGTLCPAPIHGRQKFVAGAWVFDAAVEDTASDEKAERLLGPRELAMVDVWWEMLTAPAQFIDKAALRQKLKQRIKARI